jgi:hypothetical protein
MGKGAYVRIANASGTAVNVGYYGQSCMQPDGTDNSNFGAITGVVRPGQALPASGQPGYIEADASGSCAFQPSYFKMNLDIEGSAGGSTTYSFMCTNNTWTLNDGSSYSTQTSGGVTVAVTIGLPESGDQYYITVVATDA